VYDVIIIGGGPGGYVSAIKASQLGLKVLLVEKDKLGGTCTNVGCIPTKTLLYASEILYEVKKAKAFGIDINYTLDYSRLKRKKDEVVENLVKGIEYLLKAHGVEVIYGKGEILDRGKVKVKEVSFEGKNIIIATGSRPFKPNIKGVEGKGVITTEEALNLDKLPSRVVLAGGGAEGCEFACIYSSLGVEVSLVEMMPNLLPNEDKEIGLRLKSIFESRGIKVFTNSKILRIEGEEGDKRVITEDGKEIRGDLVILGLGRRPNSEDIGLENLGLQTFKGRIVVNDKMETNVKGVYAIGDVAGGGFAHEAMEEGIVAVKNILGKEARINHHFIPRCIYTIPEVASIGLKEEEAKSKGYNISIGRFSFSANGRALTMGEKEGFVKVILDKDSGKILGVHMLGPKVSELIAQASTEFIYPHPTLSEAFKEALLDAKKEAIHKVRV